MSYEIAAKLSHSNLRNNNNNNCDILNDSFCSETFLNSFERSQRDSNTKATPKQVFPDISCLPAEDNVIFCFVLSVWDNIVGPQTVYVWKKEILEKRSPRKYPQQSSGNKDFIRPDSSTSTSDKQSRVIDLALNKKGTDIQNALQKYSRKFSLSSVVKYVTEHTVNVGESSKWKAKKMMSFMLQIPEQEVVVLSVRFHIIEDSLSVPYCLSAVIHERKEALCWPILNLCSDSLHRISAKTRLLISKEGLEAGDLIQEDLLYLCDTLISLKRASLTKFPLISLANCPDDRLLAEKILTSHLQTMHTSLIIADSPSEANKVVMWLGQFLASEDRELSRIAFSDELWSFQPGLSVQAVIRDCNGTINLSSSKLLESKRPITLVDLGESVSVKQMSLANIHNKKSCSDFKMELLGLWHDLSHVPAPSQSLFDTVNSAAPLVKKFLEECDRLSSCEEHIRCSHQSNFRRSLKYTALAIITWFEHEWMIGQHSSKAPLPALASTFQLEEQDLKIYLSEAERLKPGFTAALLKKD